MIGREFSFAANIREGPMVGVFTQVAAMITSDTTDAEAARLVRLAWSAALSEGICPVCLGALQPGPPCSCAACRITYGADGLSTTTTWMTFQ